MSSNFSSDRPDPDALLAQIEAEQAQAARGKLKVFFGASPGVGKTFAMLSAAKALQAQGVDVLAGVVETHGRSETAKLLQGLESIPQLKIEYRGHTLHEFDLDAVLARKPALVLVDELAHTNAPGSRHSKRWQDVEELLDAGIDVLSTINVQHLDSLNDVVGGITGARVWETVPDRIFDRADEVVLVDLSPEELQQRLKEGKVYIPHQAERAMSNFFRRGNLLALRELALRRTADRVDDDMRAYRLEKSVTTVWPTRESLLVCIGAGRGNEKLVRNAARMAAQWQMPWHAICIETPYFQQLPDAERAAVLRTLELAERLGAETASVPGHDAAEAVAMYAREHNLGRVVVGRDDEQRSWQMQLMFWRRGFSQRLAKAAPELDITQVALAGVDSERRPVVRGAASQPVDKNSLHQHRGYLIAAGAMAGVTLLATPFHGSLELANIVMLYLLAVFLTALRVGRGPAVLSAFLSVIAFDLFFVPPRLSLGVSDVQYVITFGVLLAVALVTGQMTARLRFQASTAEQRERHTRAMYEMARDLSAALTTEDIAQISHRFIEQSYGAPSSILLPVMLSDGRDAELTQVVTAEFDVDIAIAQWAFEHDEAAGLSTDTLPSASALYMPLKGPMRTRGVLALKPIKVWLLLPEQQRLLQTCTTLIAIALERVHYVSVAQDALVQMESERLRNSLLSALSHDLRTPLTALVGLADMLMMSRPVLEANQADLAQSIRDEAMRTSAQVHNLLDMARLQAGQIKLKHEWQPLEEAIGAALQARASMLSKYTLKIELAADLPLVEFDAVLMERVFCNLLENAAKYTPPGSTIWIYAKKIVEEKNIEVEVADNGPGLPVGKAAMLFEKFTRGQEESSIAGVGLGLSIVRAIIEAHGGMIHAENRAEGGARFVFTLPAGEPPSVPDEAPNEAVAEMPIDSSEDTI